MQYFDIHTHQPSVRPNDIAIVNIDSFRNKFEFPPKETGIPSERNYFSCGIHPRYIDDVERQLDELQKYLSLPEVVLLGEAGFDKLAQVSVFLQQDVFLAQADLAEKYCKPMIIHCVKAWQEIEAAKNKIKPRVPWIIHGFRGNDILATQLIRQGFYLSFGEYFNLQAVRIAWPGRLFVETDDKPVDVRIVYRKIAEALFIEESRLVEQVAENVARLGLIK